MLKQDILTYLDLHRQEYTAGETLASNFSVSRAAVWSAIRSLRSSGVEIEVKQGQGYRLGRAVDVLNADVIQKRLCGAAQSFRICVKQSLPSTNRTLRELALEGEADGSVLIAMQQSAGYGRYDRKFFSPAATGLYMSLLVRRPIPAQQAVRMTAAAAVATAQAIEELSGRCADIKWVNDIFLDGKKVCGILVEGALAQDAPQQAYAVIGIGVNVLQPKNDFPADIAQTATAMFSSAQDAAGMRARLAAEILNRLATYLSVLEERPFLSEYRRRSILPGREINILQGDGSRRAVAIGIDDEFRLLVRYENGEETALNSGEVSVVI